MTIILLLLLLLIFLAFRNIEVMIFLNKLNKDIGKACLLRTDYLLENTNGDIDVLYLFKIYDNILTHYELVFKYPFKNLAYKNILNENDYNELNKWLNIKENG